MKTQAPLVKKRIPRKRINELSAVSPLVNAGEVVQALTLLSELGMLRKSAPSGAGFRIGRPYDNSISIPRENRAEPKHILSFQE